eukprot:15240418-Alexandrium_andersonii.AAC.1
MGADGKRQLATTSGPPEERLRGGCAEVPAVGCPVVDGDAVGDAAAPAVGPAREGGAAEDAACDAVGVSCEG